MTTIIIIVCVFLYIICGIFTGVLTGWFFADNDFDLLFVLFFWPLSLSLAFLWLIFVTVPKLIIEYIEEKTKIRKQ